MALTAGTRLGSYEITGTLGAGGMGEVYRARDLKLERSVAIKILPAAFADDPEHVARFEREAKTLATLNHPHIAQIYGFEQHPGGSALAMELVEGEDLAHRLARGPLPLDEAVAIARQIALALEAAHDVAIVHRDLKPANIKLRADGTVKVLDFGLAKAVSEAAGARAIDPRNSPTITSADMTVNGVVLGTAAYMSPEQARGRTVDRRADIWAFGVVLYEMLTGRQAFAGDTVSDTIAAVLTREPDLSALPASTPSNVRYVLERCLQKDPGRRFHHIADARLELDGAVDRPLAANQGARSSWRATVALAVLAAVAIAGGAASWWQLRFQPSSERRYAFTIPGAGFNTTSTTAISPNGRWIAYSPNVHAAPFRLMIRSLESFEERELAAAESTTSLNPLFSPDGQWLGFFMDYALYKVPLTGGVPERLASFIPGTADAAWVGNGTIVVSTNFRIDGVLRRPLTTVSAKGGELELLTRPGPSESHHDPHVLPGDQVLLFTISTPQSAAVAAMDLEGGTPKTILPDARRPRYSRSGHLLFQRRSSGDLMSVPFDASRLEVTGDPVRIDAVAELVDSPGFDLSNEGTLIYSRPDDTGGLEDFTIVSVDPGGTETSILEKAGAWATPRLSPNGRYIAFREVFSPDCTIWTLDVPRGIRTRLNVEGDNHDPLWRPNGQLTWAGQARAVRGIRIARIDRPQAFDSPGAGEFERVPESWSPDGTRLAFTETHPETGTDIWLLDADSGSARRFAVSNHRESQARFSPDGRWIAYMSDESGREEVYVQQAEGEGPREQISADGGRSPMWSPDGRRLFYVERSRLMGVDIDLRQKPASISRPRKVIEGPYVWERVGNYDVTPDGRFILVKRMPGADMSATARVILNWQAPQRQEIP